MDLGIDYGSDLHDRSQEVDYLVITPPELASEAQRLADYRQGQGLQTKVVLLTDIYDEFNHGMAHPEAVRDFLAYAYHMWSKAPRYVVRCGDGSYDYKNQLGNNDNLNQPKLVGTPWGLFASENILADVDGSDDHVPEMAMGLLPADDAAGLGAMIDKIIAYESSHGAWRKRVLLTADNPDGGGNFHASSNLAAQYIGKGYETARPIWGTM